jgi:hypothetical protein
MKSNYNELKRGLRKAKHAAWCIFPVAIWLLAFSTAKCIPSTYRPNIHVKLLPALEEFLFRTSILTSSISMFFLGKLLLSKIPHWELSILVPVVLRTIEMLSNISPSGFMDAFLFLPYGILHYLSPIFFTFYCYRRGYFSLAKSYLHALGFMNICGVITQILLPCAPPWYNNKFGFSPANYTMPGDPAGLINVDKLFDSHIFENMFTSSPLVFGAMPSLHSAMAVLVMLFAFKAGNKLGLCLVAFVFWIWTATIYFDHHYMVDLLLGMIYASVFYSIFFKGDEELYDMRLPSLLPKYSLIEEVYLHED